MMASATLLLRLQPQSLSSLVAVLRVVTRSHSHRPSSISNRSSISSRSMRVSLSLSTQLRSILLLRHSQLRSHSR